MYKLLTTLYLLTVYVWHHIVYDHLNDKRRPLYWTSFSFWALDLMVVRTAVEWILTLIRLRQTTIRKSRLLTHMLIGDLTIPVQHKKHNPSRGLLLFYFVI